jgi:hypothetical protein
MTLRPGAAEARFGRAGAALAAVGLLAACAGTPAPDAPAAPPDPPAGPQSPLRVRPSAPDLGDCIATPIAGAGTAVGVLTFEGGFELTGLRSRFGGLSGLEALDENTLLAVSDEGALVEIALGRDDEGAPTAHCRFRDLLDAAGEPLAGKARADAEGLALLAPDRIAVSFERAHRVAFFHLGETIQEDGEALGFAGAPSLEDNLGIEALALLPSGELLAGAESPTVLLRPHPVWRLAPTDDPARPFGPRGAAAFEIASEPGFGLVGFDATPRGNVLALERFYAEGIGTRIRISWLPRAEVAGERLLRGLDLARLSPGEMLAVDNFEGITALDAGGGRTTIWIVSDDNFSASQKTLLYRFSFEEEAFDGGG